MLEAFEGIQVTTWVTSPGRSLDLKHFEHKPFRVFTHRDMQQTNGLCCSHRFASSFCSCFCFQQQQTLIGWPLEKLRSIIIPGYPLSKVYIACSDSGAHPHISLPTIRQSTLEAAFFTPFLAKVMQLARGAKCSLWTQLDQLRHLEALKLERLCPWVGPLGASDISPLTKPVPPRAPCGPSHVFRKQILLFVSKVKLPHSSSPWQIAQQSSKEETRAICRLIFVDPQPTVKSYP